MLLSTASLRLPFVAPFSFTGVCISSSSFKEFHRRPASGVLKLALTNPFIALGSIFFFPLFRFPSFLFLPVCYVFYRLKIQKMQNDIQWNISLPHVSFLPWKLLRYSCLSFRRIALCICKHTHMFNLYALVRNAYVQTSSLDLVFLYLFVYMCLCEHMHLPMCVCTNRRMDGGWRRGGSGILFYHSLHNLFREDLSLNLNLTFSWLGWKIVRSSHLPVSTSLEAGVQTCTEPMAFLCGCCDPVSSPQLFAAEQSLQSQDFISF